MSGTLLVYSIIRIWRLLHIGNCIYRLYLEVCISSGSWHSLILCKSGRSGIKLFYSHAVGGQSGVKQSFLSSRSGQTGGIGQFKKKQLQYISASIPFLTHLEKLVENPHTQCKLAMVRYLDRTLVLLSNHRFSFTSPVHFTLVKIKHWVIYYFY